MSDGLYPIRLRWDGHIRVGVARCDGVQLELRHPPAIRGLEHAAEIDFVPHVIQMVRVGAEPHRDMTHDEAHDALALLQGMAVQARDAVDHGPCLIAAPAQRAR